MSKDVFDIIAERDFHQLSQEEHSLVAEVCANEDEFLQMKQVLLQVDEMNVAEQEAPSPKVKASLDDIFAAQTFPKTAPIWYNKLWLTVYPQDKKIYQRPLIQVAAVLLLIVGIVPMMMNQRFESKEQVAKLEQQEVQLNKDEAISAEQEVEKAKEDKTSTSELKINKIDKSTSVSRQAQDFEQPIYRNDRSMTEKDISPAPIFSSAKKAESFNHPDGVFDGIASGISEVNSVKVSEQPEMLDLLTATF